MKAVGFNLKVILNIRNVINVVLMLISILVFYQKRCSCYQICTLILDDILMLN